MVDGFRHGGSLADTSHRLGQAAEAEMVNGELAAAFAEGYSVPGKRMLKYECRRPAVAG